MIKNWLTWISLGIAAFAALLFVLGVGFWMFRPSKIHVAEIPVEKKTLPVGAFTLEQEQYDAIGPPFLTLRYSPMTLQLPDLRNILTYYGKNERPDASVEKTLLHFAFIGTADVVSIPPDKPLYLVYDQNQPRIKYLFSPNNVPTSLWINAIPKDKAVTVNLSMKNEAGQIIRKPEAFAQFELKEKEFSQFRAQRWELGKWKVDGTLLARQKARWYGPDKFLEKHGGEEYGQLLGKQRIDLGEDEEKYSVYIGLNDALAWKNDKWVNIVPGEESRNYPLLVINKIEDRLMKLDIWDVDGKSKVTLNLIRSTDTSPPMNIEKAFKFVGARTRSQLLFEVNGKRMLIAPQDWLLFQDKEWKKITTPQEIDNYVDRRFVGPLFIIDDIERGEGQQVLRGTLFNATRTEMKPIEIPLQQGPPPMTGPERVPRDGTEDGQEGQESGDEENNREMLREKYIEKLRDRIPGGMDGQDMRGKFPSGFTQ